MSRRNLFPAGLRVESVADSIEEMEEQSVFWGLQTEQLGRGKYEGRISVVHSGSVQLARSLRSLGTLLRGTVVLSVPVNPSRPIFYRGGLLASSSVIALRHTEEVDFRSAGSLDRLTIAVDEDRLQKHAMALWGEPVDARRKRQRLSLAEPATRGRLVARLLQLLDAAERDSKRVVESGPAKAFEGAVPYAILCEVADRERPEGTAMRYWLARRAADFLHAHCRDPLSIAEICAAVGANRRTLHLGFREVFGVTPMAYLTALRLNGVRAKLLNSDARDLTITQVAMNWGFSHLGRTIAPILESLPLRWCAEWGGRRSAHSGGIVFAPADAGIRK
jgi:AraC family transcriptional regulator, ethanolamine operon transcriptional activator